MNDRDGYIYIFYDKRNTVLYVGSTGNIRQRLHSHFTTKSNGKMGENEYGQVKWIEYARVGTRSDAYIVELYFISKLKPKYNTRDTENDVTLTRFVTSQFDMKRINVDEFLKGAKLEESKKPNVNEGYDGALLRKIDKLAEENSSLKSKCRALNRQINKFSELLLTNDDLSEIADKQCVNTLEHIYGKNAEEQAKDECEYWKRLNFEKNKQIASLSSSLEYYKNECRRLADRPFLRKVFGV